MRAAVVPGLCSCVLSAFSETVAGIKSPLVIVAIIASIATRQHHPE